MELLLTLLVLYGAQCCAVMPRAGVLFVRPLLRWKVFSAPGWHFLQPVPSIASYASARLPFVEFDEGILARETPGRLGFVPAASGAMPLKWAAIEPVVVRGRVVRAGGRPFTRAVSSARARSLAELLRDLAASTPADARKRVEREYRTTLSLGAFERERARVAQATKLLGWSSDFYFASAFFLLPLLMGWLGVERALLLFGPPLLVVHLVTLFAMARAHHRLFPGHGGDWAEAMIAAAFYPPALLRAAHEIRLDVLGGFHPAAVAAAVLPLEERRRFLRMELARTAHEPAGSFAGGAASIAGKTTEIRGLCLSGLERHALEELAVECGETLEALSEPRSRADPMARAYCPLCLSDYVRSRGECADCRATLVAYSG